MNITIGGVYNLSLEVQPDDTIQSIIDRIPTNARYYGKYLVYNHKRLINSETVENQQILNESNLLMFCKILDPIQKLTIKDFDGKTFQINIEYMSTSIAQIKELIYEVNHVSPQEMNISFNGTILSDEIFLQDTTVDSNSVFEMIQKKE